MGRLLFLVVARVFGFPMILLDGFLHISSLKLVYRLLYMHIKCLTHFLFTGSRYVLRIVTDTYVFSAATLSEMLKRWISDLLGMMTLRNQFWDLVLLLY